MARRSLTVELDETLLDAVTRAAADDGIAPDELVGQALKRYFGLRGRVALDEAAAAQEQVGATTNEDEAMALAIEEVRAYRQQRRATA